MRPLTSVSVVLREFSEALFSLIQDSSVAKRIRTESDLLVNHSQL